MRHKSFLVFCLAAACGAMFSAATSAQTINQVHAQPQAVAASPVLVADTRDQVVMAASVDQVKVDYSLRVPTGTSLVLPRGGEDEAVPAVATSLRPGLATALYRPLPGGGGELGTWRP